MAKSALEKQSINGNRLLVFVICLLASDVFATKLLEKHKTTLASGFMQAFIYLVEHTFMHSLH